MTTPATSSKSITAPAVDSVTLPDGRNTAPAGTPVFAALGQPEFEGGWKLTEGLGVTGACDSVGLGEGAVGSVEGVGAVEIGAGWSGADVALAVGVTLGTTVGATVGATVGTAVGPVLATGAAEGRTTEKCAVVTIGVPVVDTSLTVT